MGQTESGPVCCTLGFYMFQWFLFITAFKTFIHVFHESSSYPHFTPALQYPTNLPNTSHSQYHVLFHWAHLVLTPYAWVCQVIHSGICYQAMTTIQKQSDSTSLSSQQLPKALYQICSFEIPSPDYDLQLTRSDKGLMPITRCAVSSYVQQPCCIPYIFCGLSSEIYLEICRGGSYFIYKSRSMSGH